MLQEIFYWIFNMSIMATLTGAIVMIIRRIKRIPRRIAVFLWLIPFWRMTFSFGMDSPYSLMALISRVATKTVTIYQVSDDVSFSMINTLTAADTYFPITYKVNILEDIFSVASIFWIIVALAIILTLAGLYIITCIEIKDARHFKENIYYSEKVLSPAVYGILRPKIVLPEAYKDKDNELVILHEKMHIRGKDNLWRVLAFAIVAVHWFNPMCWIFLKEFLADIELACDERVIAKVDDSRIQEYALLLLDSRQEKTLFTSTFGGAKVRTRIDNILSFKKMSWFSFVVFALLTGAIFYVLLTNAG